jgi:methylase of polypeptide subunit release factors
LARDNASRCGIPSSSNNDEKPQNTFTTALADILDSKFPDIASLKSAPFDIITSNPPYIAWKDYIQLDHSVQDFEDRRALLGGPSGLEFYHAIARLVSHRDILKPNGVVALEVGLDQAEKVESLMLETGRFRQTEIWLDPWEKQRTVIAHM